MTIPFGGDVNILLITRPIIFNLVIYFLNRNILSLAIVYLGSKSFSFHRNIEQPQHYFLLNGLCPPYNTLDLLYDCIVCSVVSQMKWVNSDTIHVRYVNVTTLSNDFVPIYRYGISYSFYLPH